MLPSSEIAVPPLVPLILSPFSKISISEILNVNSSSALEALKEKIIQIKKNKELKNLFFIYI